VAVCAIVAAALRARQVVGHAETLDDFVSVGLVDGTQHNLIQVNIRANAQRSR